MAGAPAPAESGKELPLLERVFSLWGWVLRQAVPVFALEPEWSGVQAC